MTFSERSETGEIGERLIQKQFNTNRVSFEENPEMQRSGIDGTMGDLTYEVKTREPETKNHFNNGPDILIEITSVIEEAVLGWIYTSVADILFYGILNQQRKNWQYLWRIDLPRLQAWWKSIEPNIYPIRIAITPGSHSTKNRVVPYSDIPRHIWSECKIENLTMDLNWGDFW